MKPQVIGPHLEEYLPTPEPLKEELAVGARSLIEPEAYYRALDY
jgi:hypothetical protein